jgi:hypothetical protein
MTRLFIFGPDTLRSCSKNELDGTNDQLLPRVRPSKSFAESRPFMYARERLGRN